MMVNNCFRNGLQKVSLSILILLASLISISCSSDKATTGHSDRSTAVNPSKGFVAEMISTIDSATSSARLMVKDGKIRMEVIGGRKSSTMIADYNKQKIWLLIPSTVQYKEFPIEDMGNTVPQFFNPDIKLNKKKVGEERISNIPALKYKVNIADTNKQFEGYLWEAKSLPGYPLKWQDTNADIEVFWKKARIEELADDTFKIPENYTELKKVPVEQDDSQCR